MARKKNAASREQLTGAELQELRLRLASMKLFQLEIFYKATHNACRYDVNGRVPCPRALQELVQAWKALRRAGD